MQAASEKAEIRPRPRAEPTVAVALGLPKELIAGAAAEYERETGAAATARETIRFAVDEHLSDLVEGLHRLGFRGGEIGKRRPRRIRKADWDRLQEASDATGIAASALLRACLQHIKEGQ